MSRRLNLDSKFSWGFLREDDNRENWALYERFNEWAFSVAFYWERGRPAAFSLKRAAGSGGGVSLALWLESLRVSDDKELTISAAG